MAKTAKKAKKGEQMDLIDVHPKNSKEIISVARAYKATQKVRIKALAEEIQLKQKIIDLTKKAGIKPMADGKIKFKLDGLKISITPRDELVQIAEVKSKKEKD
ncbi:hypothetical protein LCGC14_2826720 [marine sediment metagenome]|uniref:Uncharacterized protein n=1 Tax=marine sediment metagenome TaxID=412755 RepID=A0A0F8Z203_9ZZZZ